MTCPATLKLSSDVVGETSGAVMVPSYSLLLFVKINGILLLLKVEVVDPCLKCGWIAVPSGNLSHHFEHFADLWSRHQFYCPEMPSILPSLQA